MKMYDFLKLPLEQQHEVAVKEGRFIQFRTTKGEVHSLYGLHLFFVDLIYVKFRLHSIKVFKAGHLLDLHSQLDLEI